MTDTESVREEVSNLIYDGVREVADAVHLFSPQEIEEFVLAREAAAREEGRRQLAAAQTKYEKSLEEMRTMYRRNLDELGKGKAPTVR